MNVDYGHQPQQSRWSGGLCGCGEDVVTCCIACFLPCITFGQIAETVDEGQSSCVNQAIVYGLLWTIQCHWFYSCIYREKLRQKYGLPEEPCCDCCVHFCCESCALCQEHAELKYRGFNPAAGWVGPPTFAPQVPPSMFK
ncbi:cell number regulator 7-like [Pyrus communis]|uniref:cell number regulator 7-like n=1 Tax=Pyrus communis TaxID=23211 RepID=UPI0035BF5292